jgi:hypothetical protein
VAGYLVLPRLLARVDAPFLTAPSVRLATVLATLAVAGFGQLTIVFGHSSPVPFAGIEEALAPGAGDLAWRYRPVLRFDSEERLFPVNVGTAIVTRARNPTRGARSRVVASGSPNRVRVDRRGLF